MTRKLGKIMMLIVLSSGLALIVSEFALRVSLSRHWIHDNGRTWEYYKNTYSGDGFACSFQQALEPHPYLGWITGPFEPCRRFERNNRGFWDRRDFPAKRDPNLFTILVVGGSVASQLAHGSGDLEAPRFWLEENLNKRFRSPNGKPFRVLSGAMGGWRMPAQIIATVLYGSAVDAIVSLDGYNEMLNELQGVPIEQPDAWTWFSVQHKNEGAFVMSVMRALKMYRLTVLHTPLVRDSKLAFTIFERLLSLFMDPKREEPLGMTPELKFQFNFPRTWDHAKKRAANIQAWQKNLKLLQSVAQSQGLKYAHFIQPIPTLGKTLTEREKSHPQWIIGSDYQAVIINPAEQMAKEGFPVRSLANIFQDTKETVYYDEIHCDMNFDSPGYTLMADAIASNLGELWALLPAQAVSTATSRR